MRRSGLGAIVFVCATLLVSGCKENATPEDASHAFWQAVVSDDARGVAEHSTLDDPAGFDGFGQTLTGTVPRFGTTVIEGDTARVATELVPPDGGRTLRVDTHLVRERGGWTVDYARTEREFRGGFAGFVDQLQKLGDSLARQLQGVGDEFNRTLARVSAELEGLSDRLSDEAERSVTRYGEALRRHIEGLSKSIERVLEKERQRLSSDERAAMRDSLAELDAAARSLSELTVESIAEGGRTLANVERRLEALDSSLVDPYKEQWRAWGERAATDAQRTLDEVLRDDAERPPQR